MHFVGAISTVVQDSDSLQVEAVTGWGILEEKWICLTLFGLKKIKFYAGFWTRTTGLENHSDIHPSIIQFGFLHSYINSTIVRIVHLFKQK